MPGASESEEVDRSRIVLGLLESVERDGAQSQRRLAADLGIALGLVNAYLKRCVKKGLVKVGEAPARRYVYYLTPQGLAEKSRLTVEYLSSSLSFFRRARADCAAALAAARARGHSRIALVGASDLAEIAAISVIESGLTLCAVVDGRIDAATYLGAPVASSLEELDGADAVLITDMVAAQHTADAAVAALGAERVFIPALLGVRLAASDEAAA